MYRLGDEDASEYGKGTGFRARMSQEVLLSLRLLFGQTRASRVQAKFALKQLKARDSCFDQLLETFCTKPYNKTDLKSLPSFWPVSCLSIDGHHLQEEDSYSSQDDFPMFGQRLVKLQAFTLRQQPSKLRDLWRDRRNPLQWYTFWAVLVVGGLSILLGFLQLGVTIAQLVVAMKPSSRC